MLEEFYGQALSDELLQRIYGTDDEQLAVLAWQLDQRLPIVEAEFATPSNPLFNRGRPETMLAHETLLTQLPHHCWPQRRSRHSTAMPAALPPIPHRWTDPRACSASE
ncbi:MAG TPA: hypothetical protein VFD59_02715 [Nocardioidaceae bacterium]|nr:hypothetical protein [Nocardioidaceae bacterium]